MMAKRMVVDEMVFFFQEFSRKAKSRRVNCLVGTLLIMPLLEKFKVILVSTQVDVG